MSARRPGLRWQVLLVVLALSAGGRTWAQDPGGGGAARADSDVDTAPVVLDGAVLLVVRGASSLPAEARARLIRDRLQAVADDVSIAPDALRAVDRGDLTLLQAVDRPILAITDADARQEQVSRSDLATLHLARIRQAIVEYRAARSPAALEQSALRAAAATALFLLACVTVVWAWRGVDRALTTRLQARIRTVGIQSFELMRAERIWTGVRGALLGLRTLTLLAVALVYLGFVLAQLPWTRSLSRGMAGFALAPLKVIGTGVASHIPSLVFLVVLFYVFRFVLRLIRLFFEAVGRGTVSLSNFEPDWAEPTYKVVRLAVVAFGLIVAYPYIPGSESAAFKGVSLFIGVIFSLGSSTAISNIIAGYMMTYRRAFKVGDRVGIGDVIGEVIQTRLQVTHLRSPKNEELIIPNSQILGGTVVNYSSLARSQGLILHTEVGIGYETPWRQVEAMLRLAAERTPGLAEEPPPFVLQKRLGDFAVTYELNAFCRDVRALPQTYSGLHRSILDVFNEYGVQIMTPAYEGDPSEPKVVPPEAWYAAPAVPAGVAAARPAPVGATADAGGAPPTTSPGAAVTRPPLSDGPTPA